MRVANLLWLFLLGNAVTPPILAPFAANLGLGKDVIFPLADSQEKQCWLAIEALADLKEAFAEPKRN